MGKSRQAYKERTVSSYVSAAVTEFLKLIDERDKLQTEVLRLTRRIEELEQSLLETRKAALNEIEFLKNTRDIMDHERGKYKTEVERLRIEIDKAYDAVKAIQSGPL